MSRAKAAFLGSVSSQVYMVVGMLITIFTTPMIVRNLDKEEYGFSVILFQLISYLSMFDFGLGAGVSRFLAMNRKEEEQENVNRIVSTAFIAFSCLAIFIVVAGVGFAPFISSLFDVSASLQEVIVPIFITTSMVVAVQFPTKSFSGLFFAHQRQIISNSLGFMVSLLSTSVTVLFVYLDFGLWAFVYSNIITTVVSVTANLLTLRRFYPWLKISKAFFDKALLREMYKYGIHIFIISVAVQVVFHSDRIITGSILSLGMVAVYSLTIRVPEIAMNLVFQISSSVFPALVEINAKESTEKFKRVHQTLMAIVVSIIMGFFWIIFSLNKYFIVLWVGSQYYAGDLILFVFLVLTVMLATVNVSSSCLNASGYIVKLSKYTLIEAGLNIVLSIWLGKHFGLLGIIGATLLATLVTSNTVAPLAIKKQLHISLREYYLKPILLPVAAISAIGVIVYFAAQKVFQFLGVSWGGLFLVGGVVSVLLFSAVWFLFLKKNLFPYLPARIKELKIGKVPLFKVI